MSYYSGQGDYYSGMGDPGIFGSIWRAAKGVAGGLVGQTPVGAAARAAAAAIRGARGRSRGRLPAPGTVQSGLPVLRYQGPGGRAPYPGAGRGAPPPITTGSPGEGGPRRRRMNVGNARALRRAIRRQTGFVKLARRALKGTGYSIVSRGSRTRRPINVRESGPGSVTVR